MSTLTDGKAEALAQRPKGYSFDQVAELTGTSAATIARWHRGGWLPRGWPVHTGTRGRPKYHVPAEAVTVARSLARLVDVVRPEGMRVWLWLHGHDCLGVTEDELQRTLDDAVHALYDLLRDYAPDLPPLGAGRPSDEIVEILKDRLDESVQQQFASYGREGAQAGTAFTLCMAGLASAEDIEFWNAAAAADLECGIPKASGRCRRCSS